MALSDEERKALCLIWLSGFAMCGATKTAFVDRDIIATVLLIISAALALKLGLVTLKEKR